MTNVASRIDDRSPAISSRGQWRDTDAEIREEIPAFGMCLNPVRPGDFAAIMPDGQFGAVFRCGKCDGCLDYDSLILRRRLAAMASCSSLQYFVLDTAEGGAGAGLPAPLGEDARKALGLIGFLRTPMAGWIYLANRLPASRTAAQWLKRVSARFRPIPNPCDNRAWRTLARAAVRSRPAIGEDANRFYIEGLPAREHERMELSTRGGLRKSFQIVAQGFRAWRRGWALFPAARVIRNRVFEAIDVRRLKREALVKERRQSDGLEAIDVTLRSVLGARIKNLKQPSLLRNEEPLIAIRGSGDVTSSGKSIAGNPFDQIWNAVGGRDPTGPRPRGG